MKITKKPKMVSTGMYVTEDIYSEISKMAKRNKVSFNYVVGQLLSIGITTIKGQDNDEKCA